jgi:hypothetical protein
MKQSPQTANWSTRCANLYVCTIAADGTFLSGPPGWTVDKIGAGVYQIEHNLGTTAYAIIPHTMVGADYKAQPAIQARDAASITVNMYVSTTLTDMNFGLFVMTL